MRIFRRKKFKVGDRVTVTELCNIRQSVGMTGVVVRVYRRGPYPYDVALEGPYPLMGEPVLRHEWELRHA